ncbi:MAG: 2,5-diketo-D-gluconate reductase B [Candidatus Nanohaloarchaea archaeon]|jgi:2,5-diketo-D-gluconate reductase B
MTEIPELGLGTWQNTVPEECVKSVEQALNMGYRHIDTAQAYSNEEEVGKGLEAADVERQDYFLATKVWIDNLAHDDVLETTEESLNKLDVDSVDLLYVHWPARAYDPEETMAAFNQLVEEEKIDNIGVSNFSPEQIEEAQKHADTKILANQVEMHPLLQQEELLEYCQDNDMCLVAYSPLARGKVFEVPEIQKIAEKHNVSEAQVSLAWLMQHDNVVVIPKASSEDHIRDNWNAKNLELDEEDIEKINSIEREDRQVDPSFGKGWD